MSQFCLLTLFETFKIQVNYVNASCNPKTFFGNLGCNRLMFSNTSYFPFLGKRKVTELVISIIWVSLWKKLHVKDFFEFRNALWWVNSLCLHKTSGCMQNYIQISFIRIDLKLVDISILWKISYLVPLIVRQKIIVIY